MSDLTPKAVAFYAAAKRQHLFIEKLEQKLQSMGVRFWMEVSNTELGWRAAWDFTAQRLVLGQLGTKELAPWQDVVLVSPAAGMAITRAAASLLRKAEKGVPALTQAMNECTEEALAAIETETQSGPSTADGSGAQGAQEGDRAGALPEEPSSGH